MGKDPKHDGPMASTQDSVKSSGAAKRPYQSGAKAGSGGAKPDPDGGAPAAQPRQSGWNKPKRG